MPKKKPEVDDLIEQMFGFSAGSDDSSEPEPEAPEAEREAPEEGSPLDAAKAVQEAVRAHTGRRKSVDAWKGVAAPVMGRKRLSKKLWQSVLDAGIEAGLFEIDESLSTLNALEPKVEEEPEPEEEADPDDPLARQPAIKLPDTAYTPPKDWNPPSYLDCGHMNWASDEENEAAREEGHCCMAGKNKRPVNYRQLKGEYVRPVPKGLRRTLAKTEGLGWPGLCCHPETGLYIGGHANNCRWANPDGPWCEVHAKEGKR